MRKAQVAEFTQLRRQGLFMVAATLALLMLTSWAAVHWDLDRAMAARFYTPGKGWLEKEAQPWLALYLYGTIPGIVLTLTCLALWLAFRFRSPERGWHRYFLLVLLTAIIGGGILVNGVLKPYWGRPRPNQIHELGGKYDYRQVYSPGIPGKGKSFPCGHCTMGYIFTALFFFRRQSARIAYAGGVFGLVYGTVIAAARIAQGAHFFTDCLWSLGVIWLTASVLYYFVLKIPQNRPMRPSALDTRQKRLAATGAALLAVLILAGFMTRRPFFETVYQDGQIRRVESEIRELGVGLVGGIDQSTVRYTDDRHIRVLIHAQGFAWPGAALFLSVQDSARAGDHLNVIWRLKKEGYFSELTYEMEVVLPRRLKNRVRVVFLDDAATAAP